MNSKRLQPGELHDMNLKPKTDGKFEEEEKRRMSRNESPIAGVMAQESVPEG
jgi:hypothetical protein